MGGNLTEQEIDDCKNHKNYKNIQNFVESGTYKADTTLEAAKKFENVFTIEIVETLFKNAVLRAEGKLPPDPLLTGTAVQVQNINFSLGDSVEMLKLITPQVTDGAVFFIDAHQSGHDTSNNGKWVPLIEELEVILSHKLKHSVFIFDDVRLWKQKCWDWAHIDNNIILQHFAKHKYNVFQSYEKNDRFYVFTQ